jgi:hypothetical protein
MAHNKGTDMNIIRFAIRATKIALSAVTILTMMLACASQGDTADDSVAAMNVVADSGTEAVAEAEDPGKKLICRRIKPTGSRFGERVCMRQAQWEKYSGQGRRDLETMQRTGTNPGNAPDGG